MVQMTKKTCLASEAPNEYAELKHLLERRGLFEKTPAYYAIRLIFILGLLTFSLAVLAALHNLWLVLLDAALLAFSSAQLSFMVHDACHRQICRTPARNDLLALIFSNLLLGVSRKWWMYSHNLHHANPNQVGRDPDVEIPVLAFTTEQAENGRSFRRLVMRYQAFLFTPLLLLEAWNLTFQSIRFFARGQTTNRRTEMLLVACHYVFYSVLVFSLLNPMSAVLFLVVHRGLFGAYLGMTFATNHTGMPMLRKDDQMDFLRRQLLTARNLEAHPITDFLFGALSCQIEHHLFPTVPRKNLRDVAIVVKAYCQERGLPYYETSVARCYREVFQHLYRMGAGLRNAKGEKGTTMETQEQTDAPSRPKEMGAVRVKSV